MDFFNGTTSLKKAVVFFKGVLRLKTAQKSHEVRDITAKYVIIIL